MKQSKHFHIALSHFAYSVATLAYIFLALASQSVMLCCESRPRCTASWSLCVTQSRVGTSISSLAFHIPWVVTSSDMDPLLGTVSVFGNLYEKKKYRSCTWSSVCHPVCPTGFVTFPHTLHHKKMKAIEIIGTEVYVNFRPRLYASTHIVKCSMYQYILLSYILWSDILSTWPVLWINSNIMASLHVQYHYPISDRTSLGSLSCVCILVKVCELVLSRDYSLLTFLIPWKILSELNITRQTVAVTNLWKFRREICCVNRW